MSSTKYNPGEMMSKTLLITGAADGIGLETARRLVERGRHTSLLERGGLYASLHREQFLQRSDAA